METGAAGSRGGADWGSPLPCREADSKGQPLPLHRGGLPPAPTRNQGQEVFGCEYASFRTEPLIYSKKLFSCGLLCMLLISLLQILLFPEVPGDPLTTGFYGKEVGESGGNNCSSALSQ